MRRLAAALVLTAAALVAAPGDASAAGTPSTWLGFGFNQDPQPALGGLWTDSAFAQLTQRVDYIRPSMVRVMLNRSWFNPSGTTGQYTWSSDQMSNVYRVLDYYKSRGVPVETGLWGVTPSTVADDPYTDYQTSVMQADLMTHLLGLGYTNVVRFNGLNEPNVATGPKSYGYADWQLATANLRTAFAAEGLPTTGITGPDTAEADISGQDGDLGLESVPTDAAGSQQSLVWHIAGLGSFDARFYLSDAAATSWTFQASPDGTTWVNVSTAATPPVATVAATPWYRVDVTGTAAAGSAYLRLVLPPDQGYERALSALQAGSFTDPMNDLSLTLRHSSGWTHLKGATYNDWWLQSALQRPPLLGTSEAHFYDHEVDIQNTPASYPESVLRTAAGEIKAAAPGVPVILGETGMKAPKTADGKGKDYTFATTYDQGVRMADLAVQEARAGLDGANAWCLDGYAQDVQCGMWDHYDPATLRPWFYTWSLLCRYLPPGTAMSSPVEPSPDVRSLSAQVPGGWTFVLVNRGTTTATVPIAAPTGQITLNRYLYSQASAPVDSNGFPVPTGTLTARFDTGHNLTVPPQSVVLFTTMAP